MKLFLVLVALSVFIMSATDCSSKQTGEVKYKARLETKALCYNYTVSLLSDVGVLDINAKWTNEATNKSYTNVFSLANPCAFPSTIKEGEEFYFVIDTARQKDCMVCMAYYPKPPKSLVIKVVDK